MKTSKAKWRSDAAARLDALFHEGVIEQLRKLHAAAERPNRTTRRVREQRQRQAVPALSQLIMDAVPSDPARDEFRQGNTLGPAYRHWRRAKIGRRFRLFFRYDSKAKAIVFAWVNDEQTFAVGGQQVRPHAVFEKMLGRGNPPDDWAALVAASKADWRATDKG